MASHLNDPGLVRELLLHPGTWAVVGLSDATGRTAYRIGRFLRTELGQRVVPIHPRAPFQPPVFGEAGHPALAGVPDGERVDVVDCFVNSGLVGAVVDEAIAQRHRLGIRAVWLQLGVVDEAAAARARAAGLVVVMDTCPAIEYPRVGPPS